MERFQKRIKKIFITAGPVWVPIDKVRVITNIFSGNLGIEVAKEAYRKGYNVNLMIGPGRIKLPKEKKGFRIVRFKYYDELYRNMSLELKKKKYDVIVHSAAVADYTPIRTCSSKIRSGKQNLIIRLKPTIKIVDIIKRICPKVFLVKFKLEVNKRKKELINRAYRSMQHSNADLMIANDLRDIPNDHKAYIIRKDKSYFCVKGKKQIAKKLIALLNTPRIIKK